MALDIYSFLIVCPLVFIAGFVDAIAGGGALISIPSFFLAGLPTHMAIGTNRLAIIFGTSVSTYKYAKLGYIKLKRTIICILCVLLGTYIGAQMVLLLSDKEFKILLLILMPLTALYLLHKKKLSNVEGNYSEVKIILITAIISLVVGLYDGFYGPASGTFLILAFCAFSKLSVKNANGLCKPLNLSSDICVFFVFWYHGFVCFELGLVAAVFNMAGNYLGSKFFEKRGAFATIPIMLVVMSLFVIKVSYDLFIKSAL